MNSIVGLLGLSNLGDEEELSLKRRIKIKSRLNQITDNEPLFLRILLNSLIIIVKSNELNEKFILYYWENLMNLDREEFTLSKAINLAAQLLEELINKDRLTLDLVVALINKLEQIQEVDKKIYNNLLKVFNRLKVYYENKYYDLDEEYIGMDYFEKIIHIAELFVNNKKDKRNIEDLMWLKLLLNRLEFDLKQEISVEDFYYHLLGGKERIESLFENIDEEKLKELTPFELPLFKGIEKIIKLEGEQKVIYDTLVEELESAGIDYKEKDIKLRLVRNNLLNDAFFDTKKKVKVFNFVIELIININMLSNRSGEDINIDKFIEDNRKKRDLESVTNNEVEESNESENKKTDKIDKELLRSKEKGEELLLKIQEHRFEEVERLLDQGADVNLSDNKNRTPLMYAAKFESENLVQRFIDVGAKINARDNSGKNALFEAISSNSPKIVKKLILAGADPEAKYRGSNALEIAKMWGRIEIIEILKSK